MERAQIILNSATVTYTIRHSTRAKRIRLTVHAGGEVVLTVPARVRWTTRAAIDARAERFVRDHATWLVRKIDQAARRSAERAASPDGTLVPRIDLLSPADYARNKDRALVLVRETVARFGAFGAFGAPEQHSPLRGVTHGTITVRNQKTCWGSCSRKGNLSFNVRMLFLPEPVQDYVVVHELCHLLEFNHSPRFWALVAQVIPDYAARRRELRATGLGMG
jgi:predicted metal-dependent hydrolase